MKKSVKIVLKTIFIIEVLISIGIFICIPIIGESSRTRNLNNDDYYVNVSQNDCYYVVTLSPKVDIQECVVKVILYDKDNEIIYSNSIKKFDLEKHFIHVYFLYLVSRI